MKKYALFLFWFMANTGMAQKVKDQQLWLDYSMIYPFANVYVFDTEFSYQTLLSNQDKWRSLHITPTIQRIMTPKVDFMFSLPLYYTVQTSTYNTFEARVSPAIRYTYSQNKRVNSWSVLRYDFRYVKPSSQEVQVSNRFRTTLEFQIPINGTNMFQDKLYYAIVDGEIFIVMDHNINERFANARKARVGLGYRLNYRYRFEAIYQMQASRTTIDQEFDTQDSIFRFRLKMYFNAARPVAETETN